MTESVFYNLASGEGAAAIERLRDARTRVGLHAVYPTRDAGRALRRRSSPGTTRTRSYMTAPVEDAINVMEERYFDPAHLPLRLEPALAHGCPHDELRAGAFPWLQLLVAPGDLGRTRARRWGRRCARCSRRRRRGDSSSSPSDRIDLS